MDRDSEVSYTELIRVRGASEHNLRTIDVDIPKRSLVVFTGVSGSGKSSLALDTIYAEGQRRYVESLSAYARQFLGQMDKPVYESIRGLTPTIAIEQKTTSNNPRSTVGTVTEVYDYLRVLFARVGEQKCPNCQGMVERQTAEQVADTVMAWPEGIRFSVLAPIVRDRKGSHLAELELAQREGFVRVRIDGETFLIDEAPVIVANRKHRIELVVDRLRVAIGQRGRMVDSVETAFHQGKGLVFIERHDDGEDFFFSQNHYCPKCDRSFPPLSPQLFSFNSPQGMCPRCQGLGAHMEPDLHKIVPNATLSLKDGAIDPWAKVWSDEASDTSSRRMVRIACEREGVDIQRPWNELPKSQRDILLYGDENPATEERSEAWLEEGVMPQVFRRWRDTSSDEVRSYFVKYLRSAPCSECQGTRIREESQHVLVGDLRISETVSLPVGHLRTRLAGLELEGNRAAIAREPLREIENRLRFLEDVGLGYVSLGRSAGSLSGGESQRIRLASQLGTELTGVTYVLDEPSIGLHPVDTARLLATLKRLRDMGNTVVVVEHDPEIIRAADWVIDFGPGAGRAGGAIVAEATPQELTQRRDSVTADFLSGRRAIDVPRIRRKGEGRLRVNGVKHHNLRGIDVEIPLGALTVVTGVSGAGKSSLVNDVIRPELLRLLHGTNVECGFFEEIVGYETLNKVVSIDQRPIGRTPRSNPATYVKVFEEIRRVLASTREARMYGYGPGRFSFNVAGGRCERCRGVGAIKVEMHFLPDVYVQCEACGGTRFNDATLRVHYKGLHVSEILALTVDEACEFFLNHKKIARILGTLQDVGLGYIRLGQPSNTLSGGEAQRIKLSRELARVHTGQTFYILDEPTTGLHLADVERLLGVLHRLVEAGNTVVVIEHHLDVIKVADHLLDLGPGGGDEGGRLVASGTPEVVAGVIQSQTGGKLKMLFCG